MLFLKIQDLKVQKIKMPIFKEYLHQSEIVFSKIEEKDFHNKEKAKEVNKKD